jgi:hypothetical protein
MAEAVDTAAYRPSRLTVLCACSLGNESFNAIAALDFLRQALTDLMILGK